MRALLTVSLAIAAAACQPQYVCFQATLSTKCAALRVPDRPIAWRLVDVLAHDPSAFTEGLTFVGGRLFESTGQDDSRLLELDPATGRTLRTRSWPKGPRRPTFGEGLASDGERLVQLSYRSQQALTWNVATLERGPNLEYEGEGWGLCFDGQRYRRSDSSATLRSHDATTFAPSSPNVTVTLAGEQIEDINELECIGDTILANVWLTPHVVRINGHSGEITGVIDFSTLVAREGAWGRESVLNGLAWNPATRRLYVTGKSWAHIYVVELR